MKEQVGEGWKEKVTEEMKKEVNKHGGIKQLEEAGRGNMERKQRQ